MPNFGPSIGNLKPPPLKLPKTNAIPAYKPITVKAPPAPKIASVSVSKVNGGMKVQHNMTHGVKPVPFVFSDPKKMLSHLKRIEGSSWRMPNADPATRIDKALNIGVGQGSSSW